MSCNKCLDKDKVFLRCVYDEDDVSLSDIFKDLKEEIKGLSSIVNKSVDKKWISSQGTISDYVQALINKVEVLEQRIDVNPLTKKILVPEISSTPISMEEAIKTLSKKIELNTKTLSGKASTSMYLPQ